MFYLILIFIFSYAPKSSGLDLVCVPKENSCNVIKRVNLLFLIDNSLRAEDDKSSNQDYVDAFREYILTILDTFKQQLDHGGVRVSINIQPSTEPQVALWFEHTHTHATATDIAKTMSFGESSNSNSKFQSVVQAMITLSQQVRLDVQMIIIFLVRRFNKDVMHWTDSAKFSEIARNPNVTVAINVVTFTANLPSTKNSILNLERLPIEVGKGNIIHEVVFNRADVTSIAKRNIECICEDVTLCQYNLIKNCYWKNNVAASGTNEICESVVFVIPTYGIRSCPSNKSIVCTDEDCNADCDLKGWTNWDECVCPSPRVNNIQTRRRNNYTKSKSDFTLIHCKSVDVKQCAADVCAKRRNKETEDEDDGAIDTILYIVVGILCVLSIGAVMIIVILLQRRRKRRRQAAMSMTSATAVSSAITKSSTPVTSIVSKKKQKEKKGRKKH